MKLFILLNDEVDLDELKWNVLKFYMIEINIHKLKV